MSASLIIYGAVAVATVALVWAARKLNIAARSRESQARALAYLDFDSAGRQITRAPASGRPTIRLTSPALSGATASRRREA